MDEIDIKKKIIKVIITLALAFFIPLICIFGIALITNEDPDTTKYVLSAIGWVILGFALLAIICYLGYFFIQKYIRTKNVVKVSEEQYYREVLNEYTPGMISVLYDLNTEVYRDYTATIINLCIKGYLKLEKDKDNSFQLIPLKEIDQELKPDEVYAYECIKYNKKFNDVEFKNIIFKQLEEMDLIKKDDSSKNKKISIILTFIAIILVIFWPSNNSILSTIALTIIMLLLVGSIFVPYIKKMIQSAYQIKKYKRTKKGIEVAKKCRAIKAFLKDYTLIKEKQIDYYTILEQYLPYALSLGEADTIEKMIKEDDQYRELIYNIKKY